MKEIASTDFYTYTYAEDKNRLYVSIRGKWYEPTDVPEWTEDSMRAVRQASPGYTVLVDLTELEALLLPDLLVQVQKAAVETGVRKTAELHREFSIVAKAQAGVTTNESKIAVRQFTDRIEAEAWLDEE